MFQKKEPDRIKQNISAAAHTTSDSSYETAANSSTPSRKEEKGGAPEKKRCDLTWVIPIVIALLIINIFYLTKNRDAETSDRELAGVVYARKDIPAHTYISPDDIEIYFVTIRTDSALIPADSYDSIYYLPQDGFYVCNSLKSREIVRATDITTDDPEIAKYSGNDYLLTSIEVKKFSNACNGKIRAGDIINIYAGTDTNEKDLKLIAENVYVTDTVDRYGNPTSDDDLAVSFTIRVTPNEITKINAAISNGNIQMYLHDKKAL